MKTEIKSYSSFINESINKSEISTIVGMLFQSRDITHLVHLASKSYAEHIALNEFYTGIIDLIDQLVEAWQGHFEIIDIEIPASTVTKSVIEYLENLKQEIVQFNHKVEITDICNILDEMTTLTATTIYKLKNLK